MFSHVPSDYRRSGWTANTVSIPVDEEQVIMDKVGGRRPYLAVGETWPCNQQGHPLLFMCQFKHPLYPSKFMRLFLNTDDLQSSKLDVINIADMTPSPDEPPSSDQEYLPCCHITGWNPVEECYDMEGIFDFYNENQNHLKADFPNIEQDIGSSYTPSELYGFLQEEYQLSDYGPRDALLKVGGIPYSDNHMEQHYLTEGTLFQLCSTTDYPLPFIVGHIMMDNLNLAVEEKFENEIGVDI